MDIDHRGIPADELRAILRDGTDRSGHPVEPFVDDEGGWPLRCCLRDSSPGDRLAIIAHSPHAASGVYRETGPVVVHVSACPGATGAFPSPFERRDQVVRAFTVPEGRAPVQLYERHRLVRAGDGLETAIAAALADERVAFVQVHNVVSQCFSFLSRRRRG